MHKFLVILFAWLYVSQIKASNYVLANEDNSGPSPYVAMELRGDRQTADMVANSYGFKVVHEIPKLRTFILQPIGHTHEKRDLSALDMAIRELESDPHVHSAEQQHYRIRVKRGLSKSALPNVLEKRFSNARKSQKLQTRAQEQALDDLAVLYERSLNEENAKKKRSARLEHKEVHPNVRRTFDENDVERDLHSSQLRLSESSPISALQEASVSSDMLSSLPSSLRFNDPLYPYQWYLVNVGQLGHLSNYRNLDINVLPAWESGLSGKGVLSIIIDDGIEVTHPDLAPNYAASLSCNMVEKNKTEPMPYGEITENDGHGTHCAGMIASVANNGLCGVGVSFRSTVAGVRLIGNQAVLDSDEAQAILHENDIADFYSISWGPTDDGMTLEGPSTISMKAFEYGATHGRNGLGNIYVMASGNGGGSDDNCGADGYVNNEYMISITSVNLFGEYTYFDESCSALTAAIFIGGSAKNSGEAILEAESDNPQLKSALEQSSLYGGIAPAIQHKCTTEFIGTSAAAPLAVGCMGLTIEANHTLSWRDMQYIIAVTARIPEIVLPGFDSWYINGAGFHVSSNFGFGVLDCSAMAATALTWPGSPPQRSCKFSQHHLDLPLEAGKTTSVTLNPSSDADSGQTYCSAQNLFDVLEYALVKVDLSYPVRGSVGIYLQSPSGIQASLLGQRSLDEADSGISFQFKSLNHFGETARGDWTVSFDIQALDDITSTSTRKRAEDGGTIRSIEIILKGTYSTDWPNHQPPQPAMVLLSSQSSSNSQTRSVSTPNWSSGQAVEISQDQIPDLVSVEDTRSNQLVKRLQASAPSIAAKAKSSPSAYEHLQENSHLTSSEKASAKEDYSKLVKEISRVKADEEKTGSDPTRSKAKSKKVMPETQPQEKVFRERP